MEIKMENLTKKIKEKIEWAKQALDLPENQNEVMEIKLYNTIYILEWVLDEVRKENNG